MSVLRAGASGTVSTASRLAESSAFAHVSLRYRQSGQAQSGTCSGGHAVTAAVVALPGVVLTYRIRHRYTDIMRGADGHARAVRMIARPTNGVRSQTPVVTIDAPLPLVYCLAGPPSLVVTTTGAHTRLTSAELEAVLAHEEAHLRQRHAQLRAILQAIATTIGTLWPGPWWHWRRPRQSLWARH